MIATPAPTYPQGGRLIGADHTVNSQQGHSVAISASGDTAVVGAPSDGSSKGAAWVFVRSRNQWTQKGAKLSDQAAGTGSAQGSSVALSASGDTAIVGASREDGDRGAVRVYVRKSGVWIQQGPKLLGQGAAAPARQGESVAISADGLTVLIGGPFDTAPGAKNRRGSVWVFSGRDGVWSQDGPPLIGSQNFGSALQGSSVAISADGTTAIIGGPADSSGTGAAWVSVRKAGKWSQQGAKLVGNGAVGRAAQGSSVAISADGNTAIVGGRADNADAGAAWVFVRRGDQWLQQGDKLVGSGAVGKAAQGSSVAISADGSTAMVGGPADSYGEGGAGACWVWTRQGERWTQVGGKLVGGGAVPPSRFGSSVAVSADGGTAVIGGPLDDQKNRGATWVFSAIR